MKQTRTLKLLLIIAVWGLTLAAVIQPAERVSALNTRECLDKWGSRELLTGTQFNNLKQDNCRYPDGPCKAFQSITFPGQYDNVCKSSFLDDEGNDDLNDKQCKRNYHGELNPTNSKVDSMGSDGCRKPEGPCILRNITDLQKRIDCTGEFADQDANNNRSDDESPVGGDYDSEDCKDGLEGDCKLVDLIVMITNVLSGLAATIIVAMIVWGGIQYSMAGADASKVQAAKQKIINALIALLLLVFGFSIIQWLVPGGLI